MNLLLAKMILQGGIQDPFYKDTYTIRDEQGRLHNRLGPAYISKYAIEYRVHGSIHRVDGPAFYRFNASSVEDKEYWLHGCQYEYEQWCILIQEEKNLHEFKNSIDDKRWCHLPSR